MVIPVKKTLPVHVTPNRYQRTRQSRWNPVIAPYLTYLWDLLERNGTVRSNNRQISVNVVLWWLHSHSTPNNLRFDSGSFCRVRDQITSTKGARGQRSWHRHPKLMLQVCYRRESVLRYKRPLRLFVREIKYWGLWRLNIIIFTFFSTR